MPGGDAESTAGADVPPHRRGSRAWADVAAAVVTLVGAQWAASALPDSNPLRLVLAALVLFAAPGYLVLAASRPRRPRLRHVVFAVGLSPPTVALCALASALVPNGFKPTTIMAFVTAAGVSLGAIALLRRRIWSAPNASAPPAEREAANDAAGRPRSGVAPDGAQTKTL